MSVFTSIRRMLPLAASIAAALGVGALPAAAKRAPGPSEETRLLDPPAAFREIESAGPIRTRGAAQSRYGTESGILRRYWRLAPDLAAKTAANPRETALAWLRSNAATLGIDAGRIEQDLELSYEKASPSGTHLCWNQVVGGVPVHRADLVIKVTPGGEIASVHNNLRPALRVPTSPVVRAERAVEIGVAAIGPTGRAIGEFKADLRVVELAAGPRLAYLVSVPVERPMGDWLVVVDARTGEVLGIQDQMVYATGSARVFDPDPETKTGNPNLPDGNDADAGIPFPGAYDIRALNDITNTAGTFSLNGPFARIIEFESPVVPAVTATHPDSFRFMRSASGFEDALVYFHIDSFQRYIQSLGFTNVNNRVQELDTHGLSGADNSHYVLSSTRIAFGEGGVDDAEDADIVIHEYGHSIQHNVVPGWGGGHEGAMGEGFGDYIAGSYSLSIYPAYQPDFVFNWDGHNEFWPGRLLVDTALHYPENAGGEVHDSGTLWCSGLIDAWHDVGRTVMDRLVFDHHFALGSSATMADAANQIIQSDFDLYGGAHVGQLVSVFDFWGFVNAEDYLPTIAHTPLGDTENTTGPYVVTAIITSVQPLDASSLKLHYGTGGSITDSLALAPTGNPNEYSASIPGPLANVDVRYYLIARDVNGGTSTHPVGAPAAYHTFHVGADAVPPVIVHTPIGDFPRIQWPAAVNATVTDNLGVNPDSVRVDWSRNATPGQTFYLARVGATNAYAGSFPSDTNQVVIGDQIAYRITARDLAATPNVTTHPSSGDHAFEIIASRGLVLVLDDDDVARGESVKVLSADELGKGETRVVRQRAASPGPVVHSANDIAALLNGLGFTAVVEAAAGSNPATWPGYALLISASGANEAPVANPAYRSAIESYVAGGGKLLIEGGEVVYDAVSTPGYPSFAANVIHSNDWDADNAGALQLLAGQTAHPIATQPNALPASLPIAYSAFGHEDSYKPTAPAYIVYGVTAQPGNGGILVYDPTPPVESAQIVVFGFDLKRVADVPTRRALLENTVEYLLRSEGVPNGSISGRVILAGQTDHSGAVVRAQPGGASVVTDATGQFVLSGLYAATYDLTATRAGYQSGQRSGVVVSQATVTANQNFILYPRPEASGCLTPGTPIPENNPVGITSNMTIGPSFAVKDLSVSVNIPHTYIGDLIVELRHGVKTVRLHNRTGGSADNLVRTYPPTPVDGPGTLANFIDDPSNGTWTLFVSDNANLDTGNLAEWCLILRGAVDSSVVVGIGDEGVSVGVAWLASGRPNPVSAAGTALRFALAARGKASLAVYDVAGRRVRTLLDGAMPAGEHVVRWDARDAAGRPVAPGVYLYRLRTGAFEATRRLVVVR